MDFFTAQQRAQQKSRWLVFWFALAVMSIIGLVYWILSFWITYGMAWPLVIMSRQFLIGPLWVCSIVCAVVAYFAWQTKRRIAAMTAAAFVIVLAVFALMIHKMDKEPLVTYGKAPTESSAVSLWNGKRFFWVFLLVGGGIASISAFKIRQISRQGGALIAAQLGGTMIMRSTADLAEKRLLNVIDEMAIAAGIPAPLVFVLTEETSLNAFAAGLSTQDSIVAVTGGLLQTMNRDELQGVLGHEISHIVNGDSRLNLRLIGILHGIHVLVLVGRKFARARGTAAIIGFFLFVVGSIGFFFGRLIQAAVSREREYLADASAVQFTRNSAGLISALNKLHAFGSQIEHPQAIAVSHLFFGSSDKSRAFLADLFATHPPLDERISRLGGRLSQPAKRKASAQSIDSARRRQIPAVDRQAVMPIVPLDGAALATVGAHEAGTIASDSTAQAQSLLAKLPETLRQQARHSTGAIGIIGGLLFSRQPEVRLRQEAQLPPDALPTARELDRWLLAQPERGAHYRLVWLDLALPVLREAPEAERQQLLVLAEALIQADGRISPREFAFYNLLRATLLPPTARRVKRSEWRLEQLEQDIACLLALIAHAGHEDGETAQAAYQAAMTASPAHAPHPFPAKTEFSLTTASQALAHLALTAPPYRKKFLQACAVAIHYDGKITAVENELLRAFAQSLDCPAPLTANG